MTDVQICNLALARLGDARITTLSDSSAQATYCSLFYAQTVEELQADFDWSFCRKLSSLTATTAPSSGYSSAFTLPTDFIRAVRLGGIDASENFGTWEVVGTTIHTNLSAPVLNYIANITDTTKFPAIFVEALTIKLAAVLAMPLTGSKELFEQMAGLFGATIQKPAFVAATEAYAPARTTSQTINQAEICRQAILRVGSAEMFKPHGEPMVIATSLYEQTRDELLADFDWAFARATLGLVADSVAPYVGSGGYSKRYLLPSTILTVWRVEDIDSSVNLGQWEIVGQYLHTNMGSPIRLLVTEKITDVTKFPPIFTQLLTTTLALKLCGIIENK